MLGGYCEGNSSIAQVWVQQGFQPCFFFTLVPAVLLSVCLLLGALQYACYVRFGRAMEPKYIPRSRLYLSQVLLSLLLALQPFGGLLWQAGGPGRLYGYMLLHACLWALSWGCAVALLQLEHTQVLVHDRTRGHGTVLLLFWALAFAAENLTLVCWRSPLWWWALEDTNQKVGWGLWAGKGDGALCQGGRGGGWAAASRCWGGVCTPCPAMPRVCTLPGCTHVSATCLDPEPSCRTHPRAPIRLSSRFCLARPRAQRQGVSACSPQPFTPLLPSRGRDTPSWRAQSEMWQGGRKGSGCFLRCCAQPGGSR